jgi:rhamnosyltransferase
MSNLRYSIILLTKNAGELFSEVLVRLFQCNGIDEAEVIMIDSGSIDKTLECARKYPDIRIFTIEPFDYGHGKTRNMGASLAKGDYLIYLVQDALPASPSFLKQLTRHFTDSNIAGVYGRQLPTTAANPTERFFLDVTYPDCPKILASSHAGPVDIQSIFFSNVASAIRRNIWDKYPFDESIIMSEDQHWAKRVLHEGYGIIYDPTAVVYHSHDYGLIDILKRNFDSGTSLRGLIDDSIIRMACYEVRYLRAGIRQLVLSGDIIWVPYFLLREVMRSIGIFLGQKSHLLPLWANYTLSIHKYYWRRPT